MLNNSFIHFSGIGTKTETKLWEQGIYDWDGLEGAVRKNRWKGRNSPSLLGEVEESRKRLEEGNAVFFAQRTPGREHWRLLGEFREQTAFLDIETTGLGFSQDYITTIALYDGRNIYYYVWGENLYQFAEDIKNYGLVVTYNGKLFDVPFIERYLNIRLEHAHIDLRYILHALGYKGGLKGCERQMGIGRGDLDGVDGYMAVLLWREYRKKKDVRALETLLSYNIEDAVNLEKLACCAYNMLLEATPFKEKKLAPPGGCTFPFSPSREIISRLSRQLR